MTIAGPLESLGPGVDNVSVKAPVALSAVGHWAGVAVLDKRLSMFVTGPLHECLTGHCYSCRYTVREGE